MTLRPSYVSVIDPISPAIERVRTVLFRPFDLGKWFVIGFCAWLAQLGTKGGGGNGGGGGGRRGVHRDSVGAEVSRAFHEARDFVVANLDWMIPVAIFIFVVIVAVMLLITWLSSRGRFMFLYCVAQNKAEVKNPWHLFREHGNSLFVFRVVLGLVTGVIALTFLVGGGAIILVSIASFGFNVFSILGIIACVLLFVAAMIVLGLVGKFTKDFVVPIMYLRTASCAEGWRVLLDLLAFNKARFFLYVLFQIVIGLAIGAVVVATVCITCCCACCLFLLPYIGTVALLPILVFDLSYTLYYLAQYGTEFNVFAPEPDVASPAGRPLA